MLKKKKKKLMMEQKGNADSQDSDGNVNVAR